MIKKAALIIIISILFPISSFADVHVNSYQRNDGTYVPSHYRSNPDGNSNNNWSTKGNSNPYTGKQGTKNSNQGSVLQGFVN